MTKQVWCWTHSAGVDPLTGRINKSGVNRLNVVKYNVTQQLRGRGLAYRVLLSGGETRLSGGHDQSKALLEYAESRWDWKEPDVVAQKLDTMDAFRWLIEKHPEVEEIHFVNDDVHMKRYLEEFRLISPRYWKRVTAYPVATGEDPAYGKTYRPAYVACYDALGWIRLWFRYLLKPRRWLGLPRVTWTTTWAVLNALAMVGPVQFARFAYDRKHNAPTDDPALLAKLARNREKMRRDLVDDETRAA